MDRDWYQSTGMYCSSVETLDILFYFKWASILDSAKKGLPPLEPKLLVIWERISEALKVVHRAISKNMVLAPIGVVLYPYLIYRLALKGSNAKP